VCLWWKREARRIVKNGGKWVWRLFQTASHFMKILKVMIFYRGFETHNIFLEVLKHMIFNIYFEIFFLKFKKILENTFSIDGLVRETATI